MLGRLGVFACAVITLLVGLPVAGAEPDPGASSSVVTEAASEGEARSAAAASGQRVEVLDQRSETGQVFANPSGSLTLEQHSSPVRTRKDGRWVGIDTTVRLDGGRVVPGATAAGVSFSGGGSSPLVVLDREGEQLSLSWPADLPVPVLSGDTATYREVFPGVDLQMRAEPAGARVLVVVKTREAAADPALRKLRYGYVTRGLEVRRDATSGAVSAVDSGGVAVFGAGTPLMWDSADVAGRAGVEPTSRKESAMPVEVAPLELAVVPDQAMLTAPDTVFPVLIDPWFAAGTWAWTYVNRKFPDQSYWSYGRDVGSNAGYESTDGTTQRSYFRMGTSAVNGKDIISATFRVNLWGGWSCSAREVQLWAGGDIGTGTTWNNQPWRRYITSVTAAKRSGGTGECAPGTIEFNAHSAVAEAAGNNYGQTVLSLQAPQAAEDAKDVYFWKKFSADPQLVIEYNTPPNTPSDLYADINLPCTTGAGRPVTNTSPTLFATGSDVDTANVEVEFEWYHQGGNKISGYRHPFIASGSRFSAVVPVTDLQDGQAYGWRARAGDGRVWGAWSGFCEFGFDTTRPTAVPAVSSASFPENDLGIPVGERGEFTFTSADADVFGYRYGLTENTTYFVAAGSGEGKPATVPVTASQSTLLTMYVYAVDKAGNRSDTYRAYPFYPDEEINPAPHVAHDVNADALADVAVVQQVDADETAFLTIASNATGGTYPTLRTWDSGPNTNFRPDRMKTEVGDFNGDGRSDLIVFRDETGGRMTVWLFYANGVGYTAPTAPAWDSGPNAWDLARVKLSTGDFNGDGRDDASAVYNYGNSQFSIWTFLATATGMQPPAEWWANPAGWADWNQMKVFAGDFNGDGRADVAHLYNYDYAQTRLWIHYSTGTAFPAGAETWNSGQYAWDWHRTKPVVTDVNADGKDDVVAVYNYDNATYKIWTFLATASGVQAPAIWWENPAGWADWHQMKIVAGDFDGDGRGDIGSFYNYANNSTAMWAHTSTGTAFGAGVQRWTSGSWGLDWTRATFH